MLQQNNLWLLVWIIYQGFWISYKEQVLSHLGTEARPFRASRIHLQLTPSLWHRDSSSQRRNEKRKRRVGVQTVRSGRIWGRLPEVCFMWEFYVGEDTSWMRQMDSFMLKCLHKDNRIQTIKERNYYLLGALLIPSTMEKLHISFCQKGGKCDTSRCCRKTSLPLFKRGIPFGGQHVSHS